jgi:hypothetical protein
MDIGNVTEFYRLLARTGLVDQIPNGRNLMACIDEYSYNCNCEDQKKKQAVFNRCNALYEEIIGKLSPASISLFFSHLNDTSISFRKDRTKYLRTISR